MAYSPPLLSEPSSSRSNISLHDPETGSTACMSLRGGYSGVTAMSSTMSAIQRPQRHHKPLSLTPAPSAMGFMQPSPTGSGSPLSPVRGCNPKLKSSRRQYAAEEDWRRHREKISSLYRTKRLKDVMEIMENEHALYATERMYKARFKEWGLQKNVTAAEVHKLMQKVAQEQQRQNQMSPPGDNGRVVLDVGDDLDVKRIQKYMKRRPKGLDKLRKHPQRPLDVIKSLSVDTGRGHGMVTLPTVKLEEQDHVYGGLLTSPPSSFPLPLSPEPELPVDITRLLQTFIDNDFDAAYASPCSPPIPFTPSMPPQWQLHGAGHSQSFDSVNSSFQAITPRDEMMLDFVLKFRFSHILLEQGLIQQGEHGINTCLDSLALCLQQSQETPGLNTRSAAVVTLWALLAALEVMIGFRHIKKHSLQMLYQRLATGCALHQPTMAEIARLLSKLGSREQEAAIRQAWQMISRALFADPAYYEPSFDTYSRMVDVATTARPAVHQVQAMRTVAQSPALPGSSTLEAWLETRIALAVAEASSSPITPKEVYPFPSPPGLGSTAMGPSWTMKGTKIASGLEYISKRASDFQTVGNWQTAQKLATHAASLAEMAWGQDAETAKRSGMETAGVLRPAEQMPISMAAFEPGLVPTMGPQITDMSFGLDDVGSLGWQQKPGPGQPGAGLPAYASPLQWDAQISDNMGGVMCYNFY